MKRSLAGLIALLLTTIMISCTGDQPIFESSRQNESTSPTSEPERTPDSSTSGEEPNGDNGDVAADAADVGNGSVGTSESGSEATADSVNFTPRLIVFTSQIRSVYSQEEVDARDKFFGGLNEFNKRFGPRNDVIGRLFPILKLGIPSPSVIGRNNIYVMDSNGQGLTRITGVSGGVQPRWSPDGTKIAYTAKRGIFVSAADGSDRKRLTFESFSMPGEGLQAHSPTWSPDGSKLAFISGEPRGVNMNSELFVMNADGSDQTRILHNIYGSPFREEFAAREIFEPAWSPDGSKIAFVSERSIGLDHHSEIYVLNVDGSGQTRLIDHEDDDLAGTFYAAYHDREPSWSPDGSKIAFSSNRSGKYEIYVVNPDGSDRTRLTYSFEPATEPTWSDDGVKIAFSYGSTLWSNIVVMNADGTGQIVLISTYVGRDSEPHFGPIAASESMTSHAGEPETDLQQRASLYLDTLDGHYIALVGHINDEIRAGNLDCSYQTCAPEVRLKAGKGIKETYEAIRNLEPPTCLRQLHKRSLQLLAQYYIVADDLVSALTSGSGARLVRSVGPMADFVNLYEFRDMKNAFDPNTCSSAKGNELIEDLEPLFTQRFSLEEFTIGRDSIGFLLPLDPSENAPGRDSSLNPSSTSIGTMEILDNPLNGVVWEYGKVPERYIPEIPDMDQLEPRLLRIEMDKMARGALNQIKIYGWSSNGKRLIRGPEGPLTILCKYIPFRSFKNKPPPDKPSRYLFWFGTLPGSDDPEGLRQWLKDREIVRSIRVTVSKCPETETEAYDLYHTANLKARRR